MRPLSLTMSAFGPYAETTTVDFERLGSEGIYVIAGDTGSGKTTIFDALSFALFDCASGEDRKPRSLRSDFADPRTETYVDLQFSYRGEVYRITRNPAYERPKMRGEGTTVTIANATLYRPGKEPLTKVRDVNAAIVDLLGIDRNQFGQIVMIAQGDFRRLLSASTDERSTIFRKLFGTEPYRAFQRSLESMRSSLEADNKRLRQDALVLLQQARFEDAPEAEARRTEWVGSEAVDLSAFEELIAAALAVQEDALERESAREKELSERERELDQELARGNELERLEKQRCALAKEATCASTQLSNATAALLKEKGRDGERAKTADAIAVATAALPRYAELTSARDGHAHAVAAAETCERTVDKNQGVLADLTSNREAASQRVKNSASAPVELEAAKSAESAAREKKTAIEQEAEQAERRETARAAARSAHNKLEVKDRFIQERVRKQEEIEREIAVSEDQRAPCENAAEQLARAENAQTECKNALDALDDRIAELERLTTDHESVQKRFDSAKRTYQEARSTMEQAQHEFAAIQRAYFDGQAGLLAQQLEENVPCPVCGSIDHPHPALPISTTPDKASFERAEHTRKSAEERCSTAAQNHAGALEALQASEVARTNFIAKHGDVQALKADRASASSAVYAAKQRFSEARAAQKKLDEIDRSLAQARSQIDAVRSETVKAERERSALAIEAASAEASAQAIAASCTTRDRQDIAADLAAAISSLEEAHEHTRAATARAKQRETDLAALEDFEKRIADASDMLNQAQSEFARAQSARDSLRERVDTLARTLPHPHEQAARNEVSHLQNHGQKLKEALEHAIGAHDESKRACERIAVQCAEIDKRLEGQAPCDRDAVEAGLAEARDQRQASVLASKDLYARANVNRGLVEALADLRLRSKGIAEKYEQCASIALTANGRLPGKDRISFETFVQGRYFDAVLKAANVRLRVMTANRYELVRSTQARNLQGQSGLDIDVIDHYTGKARDASSLSGGESFKASLSLALGLSDIVQAHAGGIQLDTMFIDEGFGSLDQESLQLALKTLTELTGNGKLIGIISHVEELKQGIDRKIIVEHTAQGSTLSIEA